MCRTGCSWPTRACGPGGGVPTGVATSGPRTESSLRPTRRTTSSARSPTVVTTPGTTSASCRSERGARCLGFDDVVPVPTERQQDLVGVAPETGCGPEIGRGAVELDRVRDQRDLA